MPDIIEVKSKVPKFKRIVSKLYDRSMVPKLVIEMVMTTVHISNIWVIPNPVKDTKEERRETNIKR